MNKYVQKIFAVALLTAFFVYLAPYNNVEAADGNMETGAIYAWSNNSGYINFEDVTVTDNALTGYAWSTNSGWINMSPTNGGVTHNDGDLSGYAWGDHLGWIDFSGVSIDTSTGLFSGAAIGNLIGTLTFDCPTYCNVRTAWRADEDGGGGGGGGGRRRTIIPTPEPTPTPSPTPSPTPGPTTGPTTGSNLTANVINTINRNSRDIISEFYNDIDRQEPEVRNEIDHVESYNQPLNIKPEQTGLLVWDFSTVGEVQNGTKQAVIIELPKNFSSTDITIAVDQKPQENNVAIGNLGVIGSVFDINAYDSNGNQVTQFEKQIKITLVVPEYLRDRQDLGVYFLSDDNQPWTFVDGVVFEDTGAYFYVDHLTRYAIFAKKDVNTMDLSNTLLKNTQYWYLLLPLILLILLILLKRRKKEQKKFINHY